MLQTISDVLTWGLILRIATLVAIIITARVFWTLSDGLAKRAIEQSTKDWRRGL